MKSKLDLVRLKGVRECSVIIPFLIILLVTGTPLFSFCQEKVTWSVTADVGTSLQRTEDDTLLKQGLLVPVFAVTVSREQVLSQGVSLKLALGYRNRGGMSKVNAEVDPVSGRTLGEYQTRIWDNFLSNDIAFRLNSRFWKVFNRHPYFDLGIRNDFYAFSLSYATSDENFYSRIDDEWLFYRSRHSRPYVIGLVGGAGLPINESWGIGLEYYHQVIGSHSIPSALRANFSQLYAQSLMFILSYRF